MGSGKQFELPVDVGPSVGGGAGIKATFGFGTGLIVQQVLRTFHRTADQPGISSLANVLDHIAFSERLRHQQSLGLPIPQVTTLHSAQSRYQYKDPLRPSLMPLLNIIDYPFKAAKSRALALLGKPALERLSSSRSRTLQILGRTLRGWVTLATPLCAP